MHTFALFAWTASVLFGIETLIGKFTAKYAIRNPWLFSLLWNSLVLLISLPLLFIYHIGWPREWSYLLLASGLFAGWLIIYVFSTYALDVSLFAPLLNFRVVIAVLLGGILLDETLTSYQLGLATLIFIFGIVVSLDERFSMRSFFRKQIFLVLLGLLLLVLSNICMKQAMQVNGLWPTTFWTNALIAAFLTPTILLCRRDILKINRRQLGSLTLMALAGFAAVIAANAAYRQNVSLSSVIISLPTSFLFAIVISYFFPNILEKHTGKIYLLRIVGALCMTIAAIGLIGQH